MIEAAAQKIFKWAFPPFRERKSSKDHLDKYGLGEKIGERLFLFYSPLQITFRKGDGKGRLFEYPLDRSVDGLVLWSHMLHQMKNAAAPKLCSFTPRILFAV